ncbi:APC family permease [Gammaproteobacteria bacterium]|nr:APC family permease [Gammaproteobacteria bacterium]
MSKLKKDITAFGLLMASLSAMIGSGWLLSSPVAAKLAGPAAILSWLIGGIMIAFIAICFSELSTAFPLAGGIARYGQFSHGNCTSFLISWLAWLSCVAVAPTEAQAILQYASRFIDGLTIATAETTVLSSYGIVCAVGLVFFMTWINNLGIKVMIKYNNILTIWKILVPIVVLTTLAYHHFNIRNFTHIGFMPMGVKGIYAALPTVIFSFLGFRECTSLAEEVKNPQTAIPIAAIGSVLYCTAFYMLMQSVFIGGLHPENFAGGWGALSFDFDEGPLAGLALLMGLHWLAIIVYVDAIIAPIGAGLVYTATTARLVLAMSKNGFLPPGLQTLNQKKVPHIALIINALIGLALFAPFESWQALVKFQSIAIILAYAIGPISLIALRLITPLQVRPFKLPIARFLSHITMYICFLLVHWSGIDNVIALTICTFAGLCIYMLHSGLKDIEHCTWLILMLCIMNAVGYYGQFGGLEVLSLIEESMLLLLGSIVCLEHGIKNRISKEKYHEYTADDSLIFYDAI